MFRRFICQNDATEFKSQDLTQMGMLQFGRCQLQLQCGAVFLKVEVARAQGRTYEQRGKRSGVSRKSAEREQNKEQEVAAGSVLESGGDRNKFERGAAVLPLRLAQGGNLPTPTPTHRDVEKSHVMSAKSIYSICWLCHLFILLFW